MLFIKAAIDVITLAAEAYSVICASCSVNRGPKRLKSNSCIDKRKTELWERKRFDISEALQFRKFKDRKGDEDFEKGLGDNKC